MADALDPAWNHRAAQHLLDAQAVTARYQSVEEVAEGVPESPAYHQRLEMRHVSAHHEAAFLGALSVIRLGLAVASSELGGLADQLASERPSQYAIMALSRVIVETSARSWWLADHTLPARTRVERYLVEELYSANQTQKMEEAGAVELGSTAVSVSPGEVRSRIDQLGLPTDGSRENPRVGEERRKAATDLVPLVLADGLAEESRMMVYRLASAVVHGEITGLMALAQRGGGAGLGRRDLNLLPDQAWLAGSFAISMYAFEASLDEAVQLLGYDRQGVSALAHATGMLVATSGSLKAVDQHRTA